VTPPRSLLKIVFWLQLGVESAFCILDIPMYACGPKLAFALIWTQNPAFQQASFSPPQKWSFECCSAGRSGGSGCGVPVYASP
jgi:hypothetical protein